MTEAAFSPRERAILLAAKGVGPGMVSRLERIGVASLEELARRDAGEICAAVAARMASPCWTKSPKALAAVSRAIAAARARG